jgi:hypothetical protein
MKFVRKKSMESASKALKKKKNRNTIFWVVGEPKETLFPEELAKANETLSDPHLQRSLRAQGIIK